MIRKEVKETITFSVTGVHMETLDLGWTTDGTESILKIQPFKMQEDDILMDIEITMEAFVEENITDKCLLTVKAEIIVQSSNKAPPQDDKETFLWKGYDIMNVRS